MRILEKRKKNMVRKMPSIEDPNINIINASILESMFNPNLSQLDAALIMKWDSGQKLTKDEVLRFLNILDLRLIKIDNN